MPQIADRTHQPTLDIDSARPEGSRETEHHAPPRADRPEISTESKFSSHRTDSDLVAHLKRAFQRGELSDADLRRVTESGFQDRIGQLAQDSEAFHTFVQDHFGATDAAAVEEARQQILNGTYRSPAVKIAGSDVLGTARGAYDAESKVIYLNRDSADPANDFEGLTRTFSEEMFEHFNHSLGDGGNAGDRGAKAMHALYGDKLRAEQIGALDTENDTGRIRVGGTDVLVEKSEESVVQQAGPPIDIDVDGYGELPVKQANALATMTAIELAYGARHGQNRLSFPLTLQTAAEHAAVAFEITLPAANKLVNDYYIDVETSRAKMRAMEAAERAGHPRTGSGLMAQLRANRASADIHAVIGNPIFQASVGAAITALGAPAPVAVIVGAGMDFMTSVHDGRTLTQAKYDTLLQGAGEATGAEVFSGFGKSLRNLARRGHPALRAAQVADAIPAAFEFMGGIIGDVGGGEAAKLVNPRLTMRPDLTGSVLETFYNEETGQTHFKVQVENRGPGRIFQAVDMRLFLRTSQTGPPPFNGFHSVLRSRNGAAPRDYDLALGFRHPIRLGPGTPDKPVGGVLEFTTDQVKPGSFISGMIRFDQRRKLLEVNERNNGDLFGARLAKPQQPDLSIDDVEKIYLPDSGQFLLRATVRNRGDQQINERIEMKAFINSDDDGLPDRAPIDEALRTGNPSGFSRDYDVSRRLKLDPGESEVVELFLSPRDDFANGVIKIDSKNEISEPNELNNLRAVELIRDDSNNRTPAPFNAPNIVDSGQPDETKRYRIGLGGFNTTLAWDAEYYDIPDNVRILTVDGEVLSNFGSFRGRATHQIRITGADEILLEVQAGFGTSGRSRWFFSNFRRL